MTHSIGYTRLKRLLFGLCIFMIPILIHAQYLGIPRTGKVKVKKNNEFIDVEEQSKIPLGKEDCIMAYSDAVIELQFPDGHREAFTGPFYVVVETMEKGFAKETTPVLSQLKFQEGIGKIFDRTQDFIVGPTKGDDLEGSLNFYNEIREAMAEVKIGDQSLSPGKKRELERALAMITGRFDAASQEMLVLIQSMVYKEFGMNKQALFTVFNHYQRILAGKGKQNERELLEDFIFNEFLPIQVTIHSPFSFSSNFNLWWAAFYLEEKKIKKVENTTKTSLRPQDTFKLDDKIVKRNENIARVNRGFIKTDDESIKKRSKIQCIFIVACSDWKELEKFDDDDTVEKELLDNDIEETTKRTVRGYERVIIKLCF